MNFDHIDINEMERQRYNAIKKTGEYLELNILIGAGKDRVDGCDCKMPVVTTTMSKVGPEEVGCLYATLKQVIQYYEKHYPLECLLSKMGMSVEDMGSSITPLNKDEE